MYYTHFIFIKTLKISQQKSIGIIVAKKFRQPQRGRPAGGFKGGMPSRPSESRRPRVARSRAERSSISEILAKIGSSGVV